MNENYTLARLWKQLAHLLALAFWRNKFWKSFKIGNKDVKTKYPLKFKEENAKYFAWKIEFWEDCQTKLVKLTWSPKLSTFKKAKNVLPWKSFKKGNERKNKNLETHWSLKKKSPSIVNEKKKQVRGDCQTKISPTNLKLQIIDILKI